MEKHKYSGKTKEEAIQAAKIDIEETESDNKVKFDLTDNQNQRIIIYNAIVIVEEK